MAGVEGRVAVVTGSVAGAHLDRMRELGVLVGIEGPYSNVLKIRPPLVFDENHALQFTDTLDRALQEI